MDGQREDRERQEYRTPHHEHGGMKWEEQSCVLLSVSLYLQDIEPVVGRQRKRAGRMKLHPCLKASL